MIQDYDGAKVLDPEGQVIGSVERTYDDENGVAQFVEVKIGSLLAKHRLMPVEEAEIGEDGLTVPYTRSMIEDAPDASSAKDTLDDDILDQSRAYYDRLGEAPLPVASAAGGTNEAETNESQE